MPKRRRTTVRITLRLADREREQIDRRVEEEGSTLSDVVRDALYETGVLDLTEAIPTNAA